ncbi:AAA family ATPase [Streptomyces sp. NPDC047043]|uniref:AAA family ATPase n=1 Tax=Streptomyces sp. NPDC047043 TaxID=3154497 RepID=UPI0033F471B5
MLVPAGDETATTLVGRAEELKRLDSVIARLGQDGVPAVVDIAADAGMGKSRLLGELCARARQHGLTVLRGRATEYERHTPFQTFTDAFADVDHTFLDSDAVPEAAAPVLRGADSAQGATSGIANRDRFGLYRVVAHVLTGLGERSGLVLALDDLHWADPASLELLDHLIRHPVRGRVLLLVARRARQTPHSLAAALTRGVDSAAVLPMALRPLPEQDAIEALAPDLPPGDAQEIHRSSEGNPLYFHCLLHAYRHGTSSRGTALRAHDDTVSGVPSGLGSLLLDELAALSEAQRRTVEAVAVLGDHATPAMLSRTTGPLTAKELDACISALARRDLLRRRSDGRWTLRHPLLRALGLREHRRRTPCRDPSWRGTGTGAGGRLRGRTGPPRRAVPGRLGSGGRGGAERGGRPVRPHGARDRRPSAGRRPAAHAGHTRICKTARGVDAGTRQSPRRRRQPAGEPRSAAHTHQQLRAGRRLAARGRDSAVRHDGTPPRPLPGGDRPPAPGTGA